MKKIILGLFLFFALAFGGYMTFVYNIYYSDGFRAGELIKITKKGVLFKTWEGEISQGVAEAQIFSFSVEGDQLEVIDDLKNLQGKQVKLDYKERYATFPWMGDTKYYIVNVEETDAIGR